MAHLRVPASGGVGVGLPHRRDRQGDGLSGAVAEQAHFGLQPAALWAVLAIAVELIGAVLLIVNRQVWLAAGALGVLTLVAMLVANNFWDLSGQARFMAKNAFFEHLGLICALAMAARIGVLERKGAA